MNWRRLSPYLSCAHIHQRARWDDWAPTPLGSRNPSKSINSLRSPKPGSLFSTWLVNTKGSPLARRAQEPLHQSWCRTMKTHQVKKQNKNNSLTLLPLPRPFLARVSFIKSTFPGTSPIFHLHGLLCPCPASSHSAGEMPCPCPYTVRRIRGYTQESREHWAVTVQYPPRCLGTVSSRTQLILRTCLLKEKGERKRKCRDKNTPPPFSLSWEGTRLMRKKLDLRKTNMMWTHMWKLERKN